MRELPEGTRLENYTIGRVLGAGGFGVTYLAEDEGLRKRFAIKEYFPEFWANREASDGITLRPSNASQSDYEWGLARFIDEARTLARFRHPAIVNVNRIIEANGTAYMVLDYEDGQDLGHWLKGLGRAPTQAELDRLAAPLLDALALVHENNLLHRDIAPDNIYIHKDGSPVLLDFGSARDAIGHRTRNVTAIIKSGYSPQEQYASSARGQGPWSDIYALGATLYRAVTGQAPPEASERAIEDDLRPAAELAQGDYRQSFLAAIDHALRLHHSDRPPTVAAWRASLLGAAPQGARPEPEPEDIAPKHDAARDDAKAGRVPQETPGLAPGRGRVWKAGAIAAAAFLMGYAAIFYLRPGAAPPPAVVAPLPISKPRTQVPASAPQSIADVREIVRFPGHADWIDGVAISPDGRRLATASHDKTVKLWDLSTGALLHTLQGHTNQVNSVAFSPDGGLLASSSTDKTIRLWNPLTGAQVSSTTADRYSLYAVAISPVAGRLVSGGGDTKVRDLESGRQLLDLTHSGLAFTVAYAPDGQTIALGLSDDVVQIRDAATGAVLHTLKGHTKDVRSVAYSPDGRLLASASEDTTIMLWDPSSGALLRTLTGHEKDVRVVTFSPDGAWLASAGHDRSVRLWNPATGVLLHSFKADSFATRAIAFTPDGRRLVTAGSDKIAILWELR